MQAVLRPASLQPSAARRPGAAGADHDDVEGVVLDRIGAAVDRAVRRRSIRATIHWPCLDSEYPERELENAVGRCQRHGEREERVRHEQDEPCGSSWM